ncbi:MAG: hypothetical protein ACJ77K_03305 [Bacteroidia bacterium]
MARLYISAENKIKGPWLLGHSALESLDKLFTEIDIKLKDALEKHIDTTAKRQMEEENNPNIDLQKRISRLRKEFDDIDKLAEITFSDGNSYQADDIEGLLNYVDANPSLSPVQLYIRSTQGDGDNEFDLIINTSTGDDEPEFQYSILCLDAEIQFKIKSLIDRWLREHRAPTALRIWSNFAIFVVGLISGFAILIAGANINVESTKTESYKLELKKEAQCLIEKGLTPANKDSALLLVLKLQSDYVPETIKAKTTVVRDKGSAKVFYVSLFAFAICIFRPKTIIGIGKRVHKLNFYKFWTYVIWATIGLLTTTVVADGFINFINW